MARDPVGIIPLYIGWCAGNFEAEGDLNPTCLMGRFSASNYELKTFMSTQNESRN